MKKLWVIGVCLGFISSRSASPSEKTYSVEIKDGVRYVRNFRPVLEKPSLGLKLIGKIGELEPKDPNYLFAQPLSAAEDGKGNIFILDVKDACVKKFGPDRIFLAKFGRAGQGPGEFQYPMVVGVAGSGRVVVAAMSDDFHIFENDGRYVDHFRLQRYQGLFAAFLRTERLVAYALGPSSENSRKDHLFKIFDFKGRALNEFGEPFLLNNPRRTWNANFMTLAVGPGDEICAAFSHQNRIEKYSPDGRLLLSMERTLPYPIEFKYRPSSIEVRGKVVPIEDTDFPLVHRGIGIDVRGRIWALAVKKQWDRARPASEYVLQDYMAFDVYDRDGIWTMDVPIPEDVKSFDNISISGDHVLFVDPFDQACVHIYKIVERSE